MTKKDIKKLIRESDIVLVYSRSLDIYVQANKSKLYKTITDNVLDDKKFQGWIYDTQIIQGKTILSIH